MTGLVVHQCPKCELRFSFRSELEHHLNLDHPGPAHVQRAAVEVDEAPAADALPAAPPVAPPFAPAGFGSAGWRLRFAGALVAVAFVLLVAYAAVFASTSTAVVIAVLVLVLAGIHVRRSRGRARLPRR